MPQSGWLKHQKCISTQFWRPEVQNQDGFVLRILFPACTRLPSLCALVVCALWGHTRVSVLQVPLLIRTPVMLGEGPAWWPHLSPNTVIFWSTRDEGFNIWIWREHSSVHITKYPFAQYVWALPGNSLCPEPSKNRGDKKEKQKRKRTWQLYNFDGT